MPLNRESVLRKTNVSLDLFLGEEYQPSGTASSASEYEPASSLGYSPTPDLVILLSSGDDSPDANPFLYLPALEPEYPSS